MRWFTIAGAIGVAVEVVLTIWSSNGMVRPAVLLTLWPTSIVGMANTGPFKLTIPKLLILAVMYGGNFLLYGIVGAAARYLTTRSARA
jgi:hypothetical protein